MGGSGSCHMHPRLDTPRERRSLIPRPRLVAKLHAAIGNGLIVANAPAGFGKSTLLAEFARDLADSYAVRWTSLDSSCCVPEVFAERVSLALAGDRSVPPGAIGKEGDLKAYIANALAMAGSLPEPTLLVLDNLQEVGTNEATLDLLGWLLEATPEGIEIILSGRSLPSLITLDERLASGDCLLLGSQDLAFDAGELASAIERARSSLTPDDVQTATDGWPVGVMAILSGTLSASGSRERRQEAAWTRFLGTQVWGSVPAHLQPAMLRLALPAVVDAPLANRLAGPGAWVTLSAWLADHDFLYEPLAGDRIRFNPLLRTYLQEQFRRSSPLEFDATVADLASRAERDGCISLAIEYARTSGQEALLAAILERQSQGLIHHGSFQLLWHGYEVLPPELIASHPLLAAIRARILAHTGRAGEALNVANELLADPEVRGSARVHATLARMRGLRLLGKIPELIQSVSSIRAVEECADESVLSELAYHDAEVALSALGDLDRSERLLRQTIEHCDPAVHPLGLLAQSTLGQLLTIRGDGPGAVNMLTQSAEGWRRLGSSSNLGWVLNNLGMAHLQVGDFESAVQVLNEARAEGIRCENQRNTAYATASIGDAELGLGHWQAARERYEEAIKICAEDAPDETLAALSIAGLSGALLGLGDLTQADFFIRRAMLVAVASGNSFEIASCKLQEAAIESATGNHVVAVRSAEEAAGRFEEMDAQSSFTTALYRLAICHFKAGDRLRAQGTLDQLTALLSEPWMFGVLLPLVREQPMFGQWASARGFGGEAFRALLARHAFESVDTDAETQSPSLFPIVRARSLGRVSVRVGDEELSDESWASARAKEMFFLFLANRQGIRKEEAVELLYPELAPEKCNSAFHSNLYRVRRALYGESVVKRDGTYLLNPDASFEWDLESFETLMHEASSLPQGSDERATRYEEALRLYRGPFAEAFYSEWAAALRERVEDEAHQALAALAGFYAARNDFESAAACMERVLESNALNEEAAYRLATYRLRSGHAVVALDFLDSFRRTYEEEFGEHLPERFARLRSDIAAGATA